MSIVVTEKDHYEPARELTKREEQRIDASATIKKWQKRGLLSQKILSPLLAVVIFPLVALWSVIIGGFIFAFSFSLITLKFLGSLFSDKKN